MFYYFDKQSRRCCLTSSSPVCPGMYQEVEHPEIESDCRTLIYITCGNTFVVEVDTVYSDRLAFEDELERLKVAAQNVITYYNAEVDFGPADKKDTMVEYLQTWRRYLYELGACTCLPYPQAPTNIKE